MLTSINLKMHPEGILIDSAKAFDSIDHAFLLNKLNFCGIQGKAANCF
jgi:hypothetical protein